MAGEEGELVDEMVVEMRKRTKGLKVVVRKEVVSGNPLSNRERRHRKRAEEESRACCTTG